MQLAGYIMAGRKADLYCEGPSLSWTGKKPWQASRVLAAMIPFCEIIIIFTGVQVEGTCSAHNGAWKYTQRASERGEPGPLCRPPLFRAPLKEFHSAFNGSYSYMGLVAQSCPPCDASCDIKPLRHDLLLNIILSQSFISPAFSLSLDQLGACFKMSLRLSILQC